MYFLLSLLLEFRPPFLLLFLTNESASLMPSTISTTTRITMARQKHATWNVVYCKSRTVDKTLFENQHEFFRNTDLFTTLIPSLFEALPLPHDAIPRGIVPVSSRNKFQKTSTFAMILSYNGIHFPGGYEHNPNLCTHQQPTVRGVLTQRVAKVLQKKSNHKLHISTAGRTDAFVSAKSALCSFTTSTLLVEAAAAAAVVTAATDVQHSSSQIMEQEDTPFGALCRRLNEESQNNDITVHSILPVSSSFHATFSTTAREYVYVLPILLHNPQTMNDTLLQCFVADKLLNSLQNLPLDYFAFSSGKVKTATTICTMKEAGCWLYNSDGECLHYATSVNSLALADREVTRGFGDAWRDVLFLQEEQNLCCCLVFRLKADRFLRRMIRKLINALLQETMHIINEYKIGLPNSDIIGKEDEWKNRLIHRLEQKDRSNNPPAPPIGLCLWRVEV